MKREIMMEEIPLRKMASDSTGDNYAVNDYMRMN